MKANPAAFDCGQLSERMAAGYFAHRAAIALAADPRAITLAPDVQSSQIVPVGYVSRKDGTQHSYHYLHFLKEARSNALIAEELDRVWLTAALLAVGDAAAAHDYFDRAPELELLRHLRNGIAHGNRFRIDKPANLTKYPAHNKLAWVRSDTQADFEITSTLQGQPVLFNFMGAGDVLDLLSSVGLYLIRMGNGDALRR